MTTMKILSLLIMLVGATAFQLGHADRSRRSTPFSRRAPLFASNLGDTEAVLLEEIRSMRVKEIKTELATLRISTVDAFEKEELVQRLYKARQSESSSSATAPTEGTPSDSIICGPLFFTSMDAGRQIAALNDVGLTINPSEQPYATIQVKVKNGSGREFHLSLLLDTACSGLVLRPSVVKRYNLPSYSNPVTMTGAGGTTGATGLTQINQVEFGGETMSGSMPAAVQDIGALPSSLDGIIGLSMLSQFACVEMDFRRGMLTLYKKDRRPPVPDNLKIVAEAEMRITKLGIWICDVMLDGRGPVRMLVDSGAASSFLNWKGVSDLGLSRDSPLLRPNSSTGAMGSDNVAMRLTNRLFVQQNLNLGWRPAHDGLVVSGKDIAVDIGDIAVLETLSGDGMGGILGIDVLMRCALVRMTFNGPVPRITLMN